MNYELCYEEGDYVTMIIENVTDLNYCYEQQNIAYCDEDEIYYDPSDDCYYNNCAESFSPHNVFTEYWLKHVRFYFKDGLRCYLPEQDPSMEDKKPTKKNRRSFSTEDIVNFLRLDTMAMCQATNWNGANHPTTSWEEQLPCSFAIKSLVQNRCMFWCVNLDGHCDSCEAYDHKTGTKVNFDRIDFIKERDIERERKNLPPDHHFQDARDATSTYLSKLYTDKKLTLYKTPSGLSIFYDPDWDVFYNHTGTFLEEMTTTRRKQNIHPEGFVKSGSYSITMEKDVSPFTPIITDKPNFFNHMPDNSGSMDSLEMHELLHTIRSQFNLIFTDGSDE
jgi:hypothetical protein